MKKRNNKKGFTLAELLIVVAIIAVLTAIAIPVFSAQLNKSKAATDLANIRSGYAAATSGFLTGDYKDGETVTLLVDGTVKGDSDTTDVQPYVCKGDSDNADATATIGGLPVKTGTNAITWEHDDNITYTFGENGVESIGGGAVSGGSGGSEG